MRLPSGHSPFDLVIIDMLLGEALDGLQIIEQIQRLFPAQKVDRRERSRADRA